MLCSFPGVIPVLAFIGEMHSETETEMRCSPTDIAIEHGVRCSSETSRCWWLRSNGISNNRTEYVHYDGSIGCCGVNYAYAAVGPAMWIKL